MIHFADAKSAVDQTRIDTDRRKLLYIYIYIYIILSVIYNIIYIYTSYNYICQITRYSFHYILLGAQKQKSKRAALILRGPHPLERGLEFNIKIYPTLNPEPGKPRL